MVLLIILILLIPFLSSKEWETIPKSEREKLQQQNAEDGEFWLVKVNVHDHHHERATDLFLNILKWIFQDLDADWSALIHDEALITDGYFCCISVYYCLSEGLCSNVEMGFNDFILCLIIFIFRLSNLCNIVI